MNLFRFLLSLLSPKRVTQYHSYTCNYFFKLDGLEMLTCTFVIDKVKLKLQLNRQFSLVIAMHFSDVIALLSQWQIVTWPQGVPEKSADRTIARIFRVFIFLCKFSEIVALSTQAVPHRNLIHNGNTISWNCIAASQVKNCTALPYKT